MTYQVLKWTVLKLWWLTKWGMVWALYLLAMVWIFVQTLFSLMQLFKPRPKSPSPPPPPPPNFSLDQVLVGLSDNDVFTVRDACEGVQIFGGIGSGKTSGSGAMLAKSFLQAGFGGVVLTAKPDETRLWQDYARQTGRSDDLIIFGADAQYRFNALEYECQRPGLGAGLTENLIQLFDTLSQVAAHKHSGAGQDESFWRNELNKLLRNAIDLLRISKNPVTLPNIHQAIQSAPMSLEQVTDENWQADSYLYHLIQTGVDRNERNLLSPRDQSDFSMCCAFWSKEFPTQPKRQRATVFSQFTGLSDVFLRGLLRELFCTTTNITPEDTLQGKVIILDLPQKNYNEVGVYAQVLFKYCWQRAVERRENLPTARPVFLWADEAQHFVNEHDVVFQTTARSARACTVYLTQNLPNYLFTLGGNEKARALVDSLLGNLVTKIFHNNTCTATNQYAADLFARDWHDRGSTSTSFSGDRHTFGSSSHPQLEYTVLPRHFSGLMKGGPQNNFAVEAIIHQGGKVFNTSGINALRTVFFQMPSNS